jgi:creatinine amidohydrolase/Fe(II)-dependent formamide hydrolase-like protein
MLRFLAVLLASLAALARAESVYIEDLAWTEVRDAITAGKTTALVYAGSTEQKGPHMAIGAHNFTAHYVGGRIAEKLGDALVYPILPYAVTGDPSAKSGHMGFPGSVSLSPATYRETMREIALSAIVAGFKQVYLMGDHGGGQDELKRAAESLDAAWAGKGVRVRYVPDLYYKAAERARKHLEEMRVAPGAHAGAHDTSELMFLDGAGKWIRRDKLAKSDAAQRATTGVDGDPTASTPALGKLFLDYKIDAAVAQIRALRASGK